MTTIPQITADEVRTYRDAHGCGLLEARNALMKQRRIEILVLASKKLEALRQSPDEATKDIESIADILELILEVAA